MQIVIAGLALWKTRADRFRLSTMFWWATPFRRFEITDFFVPGSEGLEPGAHVGSSPHMDPLAPPGSSCSPLPLTPLFTSPLQVPSSPRAPLPLRPSFFRIVLRHQSAGRAFMRIETLLLSRKPANASGACAGLCGEDRARQSGAAFCGWQSLTRGEQQHSASNQSPG